MGIIAEENRVVYYDQENQPKGEVTFTDIDQDTVELNHTFVDSSLRGMGMAGQLMEAAVKEIRRRGKKAVPTCSYGVKWLGEHEEYKDIVKEQ